jgi:hypothetical protein
MGRIADWTEEFTRDNHIDPSQLDVECTLSSEIFYKWAERAINTRRLLEEIEFEASITEASLQMKVRNSPEKYKLDRVTEGSIDAVVKTHPSYVEIQKKLMAAREEAGIIDRMVRAIDKKDGMLKELISLHAAQYFAGPSVPRDLPSKVQERRKASAAEVIGKQAAQSKTRGR